MIIYILLLCYILFFAFLLSNRNVKGLEKVFIVTSCLLFSLVAGLRNYTVGADTEQYYRAFQMINLPNKLIFSNFRYEYGFTWLCRTLGHISNNPQILLFVSSIFINIVYFRFINKNSNNKVFSVLIYLLFNLFFLYMNTMREAIALSFILIGYEFLKEQKNFRFIIFVLIASLFHFSALLALLLIPLKKIKYSKNFTIVLLLTFIVFFIFGKNIFGLLGWVSPRIAMYIGSQYDTENYFGALLEFFVYFIFFVIGFVIIKKYKPSILKDKTDELNTTIGIIGVLCILSILVMRVSIFNRCLPYFSAFVPIWLSNTTSLVKEKRNQLMIKVILISILLAYFFTIILFRPEWFMVVPYEFYR